MKSLGQTLFELSRYNKVWTDRQTDRRTDGQTDKVITIGLPHLRWRGPNKLQYHRRFLVLFSMLYPLFNKIQRNFNETVCERTRFAKI